MRAIGMPDVASVSRPRVVNAEITMQKLQLGNANAAAGADAMSENAGGQPRAGGPCVVDLANWTRCAAQTANWVALTEQ